MPDEDPEAMDDLQHRLRSKDREIERLRRSVREQRMVGIAVGVLLARTPGWTEHDAIAAWERACSRYTRGGNTGALASFVVQTGGLPAEVVPVVA